jgi:DNA-binding response OmpR family regulator
VFDRARILIVEDDPQQAELLADRVEACGGSAVGPFSSFRETERYIETSCALDGAILDFRLADGEVTPIATHLLTVGVPVVICAGAYVPDRLRTFAPHLAYMPKPVAVDEVLVRLNEMIQEKRRSPRPTVGPRPERRDAAKE